MVVSNAKSPLRNRSRRASFCFSSVVVIRESYYSEIHNGPDCDRSVEIPEISYDVSLGKLVMSKWSGTFNIAIQLLQICLLNSITVQLVFLIFLFLNTSITDFTFFFPLNP